MKKRAMFTLTFLLAFSLLIIPLTSAEIIISNPSDLYSYGDVFNLDITLSPSTEASDFLIAEIVCSSDSAEILKAPYSIQSKEKRKITIETRLDSFLIKDIQGTCFLRAEYDSETEESDKFILSNRIDLFLDLNQSSFDPNSEISIEGTAIKANSQNLNGFIEISFGNNSRKTDVVDSGVFSTTYKIPTNMAPGTYSLNVYAYEKDPKEKIINSGNLIKEIKINQVPTSIDLALLSSDLSPGEKITYKPRILDQSGSVMSGEVEIFLINPSGKTVRSIKSNSAEDLEIETLSSYPSGTWTLKSKFDLLESEKSFFIKEKAILEYNLIGNTLNVENIGNIPYNDNLTILISGEKETFQISLDEGKSIQYKLSAPTGNHDISINDANTESQKSLGTTALTGSAISVNQLKFGVNSSILNIILWIVIIIILLLIAFYLYGKIRKKDFIGKIPSFKSSGKAKDLSKYQSEYTSYKDVNQGSLNEGKKQHSTIISLKLKNQQEINASQEALRAIDSALLEAKKLGAKIYLSESYRIIILSPVMTGQADNSQLAVDLSRRIKSLIEKQNKSHSVKVKIKFGIAIHSGDLIVENKQGKFTFTSLGSVISNVKNLSEQSDLEILLSQEFHNKTVGKIKAQKISSKAWKLLDIKSKYQYEEFIKRFEERRSKK